MPVQSRTPETDAAWAQANSWQNNSPVSRALVAVKMAEFAESLEIERDRLLAKRDAIFSENRSLRNKIRELRGQLKALKGQQLTKTTL